MRMDTHLVSHLDFHDDSIVLPNVDPDEAGMSRVSTDRRIPVTSYGHAF